MAAGDNSLAGRAAVVSGASSGIGRAIARRLVECGALVTATGRRQDRLDRLAAQCAATGNGNNLSTVAGDVRAPETLQRVVDASPGVEIAVLGAGIMKHAAVSRSEPGDWQDLFDVNVVATLTWARAFLLEFSTRGRGHIVFVSSTLARVVQPTTTAYAASKAAIATFAAGLRPEAAAFGVRVTEIQPGITHSELRRSIDDGEALARIDSLSSQLEPDDVADAVVYALSSPDHVCIDEIVLTPRPAAGRAVHPGP